MSLKDLFDSPAEHLKSLFEYGIVEKDFITSVQLLTSEKIDKKLPLYENICSLLCNKLRSHQESTLTIDDINSFIKKYKSCKSNTDRMIVLSELCRKITFEELIFILPNLLVPNVRKTKATTTKTTKKAVSKKKIVPLIIESLVAATNNEQQLPANPTNEADTVVMPDSGNASDTVDSDDSADIRYKINVLIVGGKSPSLVQQNSKKYQKHNNAYTSFGVAVLKDDKYKLLGSLRYGLTLHNLNKFNKLKCEPSIEYAALFNLKKSKYLDDFFNEYDFKMVQVSTSGINKSGELKKLRLEKTYKKIEMDKIITFSELKDKFPKK